MTFVQRLDLRQAQTLVMTPQLQQAIKLLQLSNLELADFVTQELQQNPLLEEGSGAQDDLPLPNIEATQDRLPVDAGDRSAPADEQAARIDAGAIAEPESGEPADFEEGARSFSSGRTYDGEASDLGDRLLREPSLRDHLLQQLNTEFSDPRRRLLGAALIEAVEPSGYLAEGDATPGIVASALGVETAEVEAVLGAMQHFDPPGVLARTLSECLAIQLRDRDRFDPAMAALCRNLDLLADRRFPELTRVCGVDAADLADMIREIRALDPRPGERFEAHTAQTVIPDILMRATKNDGWLIELNPDTLPRVLVNRRYHAEVSRACRSARDREYLSERLNAANWLMRSLDQRANTILKVATEIVAQQDAFFRHGISRLRPLILRDIADIIGMHESTVSRVTTNKYMATPRGMFELKYFFSTAIQRADGDGAFAAESIRYRLKSLIDGEDPLAILSDDALVEQLRREGIDIARRTIAKYREQLGIAASTKRRRQKGFAAAAAR